MEECAAGGDDVPPAANHQDANAAEVVRASLTKGGARPQHYLSNGLPNPFKTAGWDLPNIIKGWHNMSEKRQQQEYKLKIREVMRIEETRPRKFLFSCNICLRQVPLKEFSDSARVRLAQFCKDSDTCRECVLRTAQYISAVST